MVLELSTFSVSHRLRFPERNLEAGLNIEAFYTKIIYRKTKMNLNTYNKIPLWRMLGYLCSLLGKIQQQKWHLCTLLLCLLSGHLCELTPVRFLSSIQTFFLLLYLLEKCCRPNTVPEMVKSCCFWLVFHPLLMCF